MLYDYTSCNWSVGGNVLGKLLSEKSNEVNQEVSPCCCFNDLWL